MPENAKLSQGNSRALGSFFMVAWHSQVHVSLVQSCAFVFCTSPKRGLLARTSARREVPRAHFTNPAATLPTEPAAGKSSCKNKFFQKPIGVVTCLSANANM